jgi:hypothetical protein
MVTDAIVRFVLLELIVIMLRFLIYRKHTQNNINKKIETDTQFELPLLQMCKVY